DGVTQAFQQLRSGAAHLPDGLVGIQTSIFTDWTAVDSLAVARFQSYELSYDADGDIANQAFFAAARSTFTATDPDPPTAKRPGDRHARRPGPRPLPLRPSGSGDHPHRLSAPGGQRTSGAARLRPCEARQGARSPRGRIRLPPGDGRDAEHVQARRLRVQQLG